MDERDLIETKKKQTKNKEKKRKEKKMQMKTGKINSKSKIGKTAKITELLTF